MKHFIPALIGLLCVLNLGAHNYRTQRLSDLANKIHSKSKTYSRTDKFGNVCHLGLKLFEDDALATINNQYLSDFLERYLLELSFLNTNERVKRMKLDGVKILEGDVSWLPKITSGLPVSVKATRRRHYEVTWELPKGNFTLFIPADSQLLLGANIIELEQIIAKELKEYRDSISQDFNLLASDKSNESDSVVVVNQDRFLSDLIRSDLILVKNQDGNFLPFYNIDSPNKSVTQMFLSGYSPFPVTINCTIDNYDGEGDNIIVNLSDMIGYFLNNGDRLFFGIKENDGEILKGTLFCYNEKLAYCHVISIDFPLSILNDNSEMVNARGHVFIPLQNITELFFINNLSPLDY